MGQRPPGSSVAVFAPEQDASKPPNLRMRQSGFERERDGGLWTAALWSYGLTLNRCVR